MHVFQSVTRVGTTRTASVDRIDRIDRRTPIDLDRARIYNFAQNCRSLRVINSCPEHSRAFQLARRTFLSRGKTRARIGQFRRASARFAI
jgi:hypothetical protein